MIHSTLDESARYESLHPRFKEVFDYSKSHDLRAMESQRLELRGEELFINRIDAPSYPQDEATRRDADSITSGGFVM